MTFLLKRNGHYYYNRRIPDIYCKIDSRGIVRISLKTDSKRIALRKAVIQNDLIEAYWEDLAARNEIHNRDGYTNTVRLARQMGITYLPQTAVAALPLEELVSRILTLKDASPEQIEYALGGKEEKQFMLSQLLDLYWPLAKDKIVNKSPDQVRKWRNPRIKSVKNFIDVTDDKPIHKLTRDDTISFRDWWLDRIKSEGKNAGSANKDIIHLKSVIETVCEHHKISLDISHIFKRLLIETRFEQTRLPLSTEQILSILNSENLLELPESDRLFLFAAAETGARPSEIVGLLPEDIVLNSEIPHISIKDRKGRPLKTKHSAREIPLVGYALEAFQAMPNGFPMYRDCPDKFTTALNRFLRENDLLPSEQHSLYSLRHSFQDRLTSQRMPDRIQCELMGHKFMRPKYGIGATIAQKLKWLKSISLKNKAI